MNRAKRRGSALRRKLGLGGRVDAEAVANSLGLDERRLEAASGFVIVAS